jgi:hypothetical protein
MQKLNVRIVSIFLILIFFQKMGLELWLHNWLHETTVATSFGATPKGKASLQHQLVKCNCIDDALSPLTEADMVDYDAPLQASMRLVATAYCSWLSAEGEFSSLRGPPAGHRLL